MRTTPAELAQLIRNQEQAPLRRQHAPRPRLVPDVIPSEESEQIALMQWVAYARQEYPALDVLYHCPNGGKRSKSEAARFMRIGVRAGMPDLHLAVARRGAHSLYIEMKALDGHPTDAQIDRARALVEQGNMVVFCFGWEHAKMTLLWYLSAKEKSHG